MNGPTTSSVMSEGAGKKLTPADCLILDGDRIKGTDYDKAPTANSGKYLRERVL